MNELRPISIDKNYVNTAFSSVLYSSGDTKVLVTTSIGDRVPNWLIGKNQGWVTAEYSMLPGSSSQRVSRSAYDKGRAKEISRLIGRSLRTVVDSQKIEGIVVTVDCDVIQADGGTRTAAINGAWIALKDTFDKLIDNKKIKENPLVGQIAAVSVGIVNKEVILDLDYSQDSEADVDLNVVMTSDSEFIEIQGTGERKSFTQKELDQMIRAASVGIDEILDRQMKEFS